MTMWSWPDISEGRFDIPDKFPWVEWDKRVKPWAELLEKPWRPENKDADFQRAKRNAALYVDPKWRFDWMSADNALKHAVTWTERNPTTQAQLNRVNSARPFMSAEEIVARLK